MKSNMYAWLAAMAVGLAAVSCSGDDGTSMPEVPANPDALCAITPRAIEISGVDASATPLTRSAAGEPEQKVTFSENLGVNYSAEATLEAAEEDAQTRAAGSLKAGAQYRIVAYDGAGAIKGNVVYQQGSTSVVSGKEIKLKAGTYRLFCYTFNSTAAIREPEADNKVTVNSNEDFMTYTNAAFTVASTDYSSGKALNISFVRQCARLTVNIVAEGYANNIITSARLKVGGAFGSGSKWNGSANTDDATLPSVAGTASLEKVTGDGTSVNCGFSPNPYLITSPCANQTITVSGLNVLIDGVSKTPADFDFPSPVTLVKGGSYRLSITVGNYYLLTSSSPVTIGGVKWARTNLQQDGSGISASVSFAANPWDYGSHWNWGMRDATVYGNSIYLSGKVDWNTYTSSGTNQNPCRALGSGWRLSTQGELSSLVNNPAPSGAKVKINGTINTIGNYGWAQVAKGAVFISGNQVVSLPAASGRANDGSVSGQGSTGNYWSGTPTAGGNMAYCLAFHSGNLSVNYFFRYAGQPLRCVQDN